MRKKWPSFACIIDYGRPQALNHYGLYCVLASHFGSYKLIFLTLKWLMTTQFFEKCFIFFSAKKNYLTIFSSFIEYGTRQGTIYMGPQGLLTVVVLVIKSILRDP